MNTKQTETTTNSRLFNKRILSVAVATAMFGAGGAAQAYTTLNVGWLAGNTVATERVTLDNASASNATSKNNPMLTNHLQSSPHPFGTNAKKVVRG